MDTPPSPLAELGHELRTPLTAILGYADAMRGQAFGPLDEKYIEAAQAIHLAGLHLLGMVNTMTDIGRIERGRAAFRPEVIDIVEVVRNALSLLKGEADQRAVVLAMTPTSGAILVSADPTAISRIVINLTSNALRFTPPAGRISVAVAAEAGDVLLAITDSGSGLASGAAPTGEGLGLILARTLCALHGGDLALTNAPGGGTLAAARLPIALEP